MTERAQRIFEKLQTIQNNVKGEKQSKFKLILGYLQSVELAIEDVQKQKNQQFLDIAEKLQRLKSIVDIEKEARDQVDEIMRKEILTVEKNCKTLLKRFSKERLEIDKGEFSNLSQQVDQLSVEIQKEFQQKSETQNKLLEIQNEQIQLFYQDIEQKISIREEIEDKIAQQFNQLLDELKRIFDCQQKQREQREEEIIGILKKIYQSAYDACKRSRNERERNEDLFVKLVEKVVEKIKRELIDSDF
ncbi:unnamed protein product (macronuclear) [Paramecium tetraurelia]|uniref:Uncharacterized protein n=1 Tax=Paramecium tetraurelia TaxID=5888 RepID=A0C9J3_PARTE|nr:uncharacterized protein GSPATT00006766001 [Paramecium tetraurelia]CAK67460.1 unnamed protein product [Paramecium tetraurelia]|eukprot:XP_001434857.1 hypothetical protein (macronuclear) [Paramecium tetraurelia strain d4-2]